MRPHKTLRGHIHYTSSKPGREGVERGREHFTITVHGDGRRTLRAHCEIDDEPNVLRDVTLTKVMILSIIILMYLWVMVA